MREHTQIINAAGGATSFGRRIGADPNNVNQWRRANSIPAPWWKAVADAELASLEELATAANRRLIRAE